MLKRVRAPGAVWVRVPLAIVLMGGVTLDEITQKTEGKFAVDARVKH